MGILNQNEADEILDPKIITSPKKCALMIAKYKKLKDK